VPSGRLTLDWVGKDQALLTTPDGGYEWVDRTDPRVTEIRLLHERETVGAACPDEHRAADNLLIHGDAADGLRSLLNLPEFAAEYRGKVKLVYIDPPFNTGQAFEHYDDALEHSVWLTMMRDRLTLVRDLLAPDGSVWVHLDDAEMAYCRVLMDEIFGRTNFVASVVWQKADTVRNDATRFSVSHDTILVATRDITQWRARRLPRSAAMNKVYRNPDKDARGPWLAVPLQGPNLRPNLTFEVVSPRTGKTHWPPEGNCWRRGRAEVAEMIAENRIYFGKDGNGVPQIKKFLTDVGDSVPDTVWSVKEVGGNRQSKAEMRALFPTLVPFATPKPERLLERVFQIATDPGDIVLDCFAGSGTTAAVAQKMARRWVTVEKERKTIDSFTRPRLAMVVFGEDPGGITEAVGWQGGGGFRVLEVGPSMYDVDDDRVLLAEWTSNGQFAAAACAQLGFTVDDHPPFVGRRGRVRLAAVDGVADSSVVRALVSNLDEKERLVIVAKATEPGAESLLRELSSGSRLLKAPRDLVGVARQARR